MLSWYGENMLNILQTVSGDIHCSTGSVVIFICVCKKSIEIMVDEVDLLGTVACLIYIFHGCVRKNSERVSMDFKHLVPC